MERFTTAGRPLAVGHATNGLANALAAAGRIDEADTVRASAIDIHRRGQDHYGMACCEHDGAEVLEGFGRFEEAAAGYRRSADHFLHIENPQQLGELEAEVLALLAAGDAERLVSRGHEIVELIRAAGDEARAERLAEALRAP